MYRVSYMTYEIVGMAAAGLSTASACSGWQHQWPVNVSGR